MRQSQNHHTRNQRQAIPFTHENNIKKMVLVDEKKTDRKKTKSKKKMARFSLTRELHDGTQRQMTSETHAIFMTSEVTNKSLVMTSDFLLGYRLFTCHLLVTLFNCHLSLCPVMYRVVDPPLEKLWGFFPPHSRILLCFAKVTRDERLRVIE